MWSSSPPSSVACNVIAPGPVTTSVTFNGLLAINCISVPPPPEIDTPTIPPIPPTVSAPVLVTYIPPVVVVASKLLIVVVNTLPPAPIPVIALATKVAPVTSAAVAPLVMAPVSAVKVTAPAPAFALMFPAVKVIASLERLTSLAEAIAPAIVVVPEPVVCVTSPVPPAVEVATLPLKFTLPALVMVRYSTGVVVPTPRSVTVSSDVFNVRPCCPAAVASIAEPRTIEPPVVLPASSVSMPISVPRITPPVALRKSTLPVPALSSVSILPFKVKTPLVVTDNASRAVVVPTAGKVTAWSAVFIVKLSVPAAVPLMAEPKVAEPPVPLAASSVRIIVSPLRVIPPVAFVKSTLPLPPRRSSVLMSPPRVVSPDVVTSNDSKAVVVPTTPRFTAPVPAVSSNDSEPAPVAFTELLNVISPAPPEPVLKITSPVSVTAEAKSIFVLLVSIILLTPSPAIETKPAPV